MHVLTKMTWELQLKLRIRDYLQQFDIAHLTNIFHLITTI
jgi:hypothetical protein